MMIEKPTYEELERRVLELENTELNWQRLLIEESKDAIVVLDQNAKVFDANNQFADMLGYSREEVHQLYVWDWDAQLMKDQLMDLLNHVDNTGQHFETKHRCKDGRIIDVELSNNGALYKGEKLVFCICRNISERKQAEKEKEELIKQLQESLAEIKTLRGILPLCSFCKKIRNDDGYWEQVDIYIRKHSEADISHSICPECFKKYYPEEYNKIYSK